MDNSQVSDAVADDCSLTELDIHATAGESFSAEAVFEGTSVQAFAAGMIGWFREHGGENYITVGIVDTETSQQYEITMQRRDGKTPAEDLCAARAEIDRLQFLQKDSQEQIDHLLNRHQGGLLARAEDALRTCAQFLARLNSGEYTGFNKSCLAVEAYFGVDSVHRVGSTSTGNTDGTAVAETEDGKNPQNVQCADCSHVWIGLYLPQPISVAARIMKNLTCPKCGAKSDRVRMHK